MVRVAAGVIHSAAVTAEGELFTWGALNSLGFGYVMPNDDDVTSVPKRVDALMRVRCVSAGKHFTLVTMEEDAIFSFGIGNFGQLGHG